MMTQCTVQVLVVIKLLTDTIVFICMLLNLNAFQRVFYNYTCNII